MRFFDFLKSIFLLLIMLQIAPPLVKNLVKQYQLIAEPRAQVAVIPIKGMLCNSSDYIKQLHTYFKDPSIKAILLKIECHGSATGTGQSISNEITHLKKIYQKPIVALVENVCASGGYLIACSTDYIVAPGMSLLGSVGVTIPYLFQVRQFIEDHKVYYEPIAAGSYKLMTDPFSNLTPEQKALLQGVVDDSYNQFVEIVAHNRKLSTTTVKDWADGKIFTGKQALALGLIDENGSASHVIKVIKDRAMIEGEIEWVKKEQPISFVKSLVTGEEPDNDGSMLESAVNSLCSTLESRYSGARLQ
jgi:protease-4